MPSLISRAYADGSKADTPNGVNVANFLLGTGNLWDCIQALGIGIKTVTAGTTTLAATDAGLVLVDASAGSVIINLPAAAAAAGARFEFKRTDGTANVVTVNRAGSSTIDGINTLSLPVQYAMEVVRSDGTNWIRLNNLAASLIAATGYRKFTDGSFQQWGVVTSSASADVTATLAIAFPNAFHGGRATAVNGGGSGNVLASLGANTLGSVNIGAYQGNTGSRVVAAVYYEVEGR